MEVNPVKHEVGNIVAQQVRDLFVPFIICRFHSDESMALFGLVWQGTTCRFRKIVQVFNVIDSGLDDFRLMSVPLLERSEASPWDSCELRVHIPKCFWVHIIELY